jgi:hypothetical protein
MNSFVNLSTLKLSFEVDNNCHFLLFLFRTSLLNYCQFNLCKNSYLIDFGQLLTKRFSFQKFPHFHQNKRVCYLLFLTYLYFKFSFLTLEQYSRYHSWAFKLEFRNTGFYYHFYFRNMNPFSIYYRYFSTITV